ncbi:hypothetical protein BC833DRAFT_602079 [Globomyces pollinis-pini]|nr:hypothetical protein BC833DRAFT_602079 [Globomyces pollinis-pini]
MELLDYLNWTVAYQLATSVFSPIAIMYCFSNINTFYSLLFSKPSRIPKPFTTYDFYSLRLLCLSAAISLIFALWPTTNIFDLLNVHPTAPSFLLKSRIDDFSISSPPNLEPLLSALLSNYGRHAYILFGPTIINCQWCESINDYMYFQLPTLLFQYFIVLSIIGMTSCNWRRESYRFWILLLTICGLCCEIGMLQSDESEPILELFGFTNIQYHLLTKTRYFCFSLTFIILAILGQMDKWSDQDLVITSIQQVNDIRSTIFANDLLQTSIQSTPILQQLSQSQFQINQQYFKKFHQQSHIKNLKRDLLNGHDIRLVKQNAHVWTNQFLNAFFPNHQSNSNQEIPQPWSKFE